MFIEIKDTLTGDPLLVHVNDIMRVVVNTNEHAMIYGPAWSVECAETYSEIREMLVDVGVFKG